MTYHMTDTPLVRTLLTCPNCFGRKDRGSAICWPCHRLQIHHNDGGYSERLERKLGDLESLLDCEAQHRRMEQPSNSAQGPRS